MATFNLTSQMTEQPAGNISITLPQGKIASAIVNLVTRKKPIGWSKRSYGTYFKEVYGKWVKEILDEIMIDNKDKRIPYGTIKGMSDNSLYLMFQQGKMYLLQEMDSDGKYKKFCEGLKCHRKPKVGVVLSVETIDPTLPKAIDVVPEKDKPKWKKQLDEYLESDNPQGQPFVKENLQLTDREVELQIAELEGLTNVMYDVTNTHIKVIKGVE